MSFIDTDGRSARFRTRAQNWAITIESAPRSSKKWLSTGTRLDVQDVGQHLRQHPSIGSRRRRGDGRAVAERRRQAADRGVLVDVLHRHRRQVRRASAPGRRTGPSPSSRHRGRRRSGCRPAPARRAGRQPAPRRGTASSTGVAQGRTGSQEGSTERVQVGRQDLDRLLHYSELLEPAVGDSRDMVGDVMGRGCRRPASGCSGPGGQDSAVSSDRELSTSSPYRSCSQLVW